MSEVKHYTLRQIRLFYTQSLRLDAGRRAALCLDVHLEGKAAQKHIVALEAIAHGR